MGVTSPEIEAAMKKSFVTLTSGDTIVSCTQVLFEQAKLELSSIVFTENQSEIPVVPPALIHTIHAVLEQGKTNGGVKIEVWTPKERNIPITGVVAPQL